MASSGGGSVAATESIDPEVERLLRSPGFWAKLGHHPYWPARAASKEEQRRYSSYQRKATQVCVKFFGSNDIGWIHPASLVNFDEGLRRSFNTNSKVTKNVKFVAGVEEAIRLWKERHEPQFPGVTSPTWPHAPPHSAGGAPPPHTRAQAAAVAAVTGGACANGIEAHASALGAVWTHGLPESCLGCTFPRGEEPGFLLCRSCGSGYHSRCASMERTGAARGVEADKEGSQAKATSPRCRLCSDGGSMILAPAPLPFRQAWSPMPGTAGSADSGMQRHQSHMPGPHQQRSQHDHLPQISPVANGLTTGLSSEERGAQRGLERRWGGFDSAAAASDMKKRREALAMMAAAEKRARWSAWGGSFGEGFAGRECLGVGAGSSSSDDSEFECFICTEPGMLIQCDAPACRKVYHKPCLGFATWGDHFFCPRHRCAVCRISEADLDAKAKQGMAGTAPVGEMKVAALGNGSLTTHTRGASDHNGGETTLAPEAEKRSTAPEGSTSSSKTSKTKRDQCEPTGDERRLWKCGSCPLAYCPSHLPPALAPMVAPVTMMGKQKVSNEDSNQCINCKNPPPRIQLAVLLERSWARLATNYLALPFMRPFLNGAVRSKSNRRSKAGGNDRDEDALLDVVGIAHRIRTGHYQTADEYLHDLDVLREQVFNFSPTEEGGRSVGEADKDTSILPILEALDTLRGNAGRYVESIRKKIAPAEALIEEEEKQMSRGSGLTGSKAASGNDTGGGSGVAWRAELVEIKGLQWGSVGEFTPAKPLEEWAEYVRMAPMLHASTQRPFPDMSEEAEREDMERGEVARVIAQLRFEDSFPYKTSMSQRDHLEGALEEQATLLRRCLEGHAQLRRSIANEKAVVLELPGKEARRRKKRSRDEVEGGSREGGLGREDGEEVNGWDDDDHVVTLGDMHILKEFQVANQNLRARLKSKNALLRQREAQLWAAEKEFLDLQGQNSRLQEELAQALVRISEGNKAAEPGEQGTSGGTVPVVKATALSTARNEEEATQQIETVDCFKRHEGKQEDGMRVQTPPSVVTPGAIHAPRPSDGRGVERCEVEDEQGDGDGGASPPVTESATTTLLNSSSSSTKSAEVEAEDAHTFS